MNNKITLVLAHFFLLVGMSGFIHTTYAQDNDQQLREDFLTPAQDIEEAVLAPRYKNITLTDSHLGPNRTYYIHYVSEKSMAPIANYAKEYYNLGGLRIDPNANRRRAFSLVKGYAGLDTYAGLELIDARTGEKQTLQTPDGAHVSHAKWSPDGTKIAYFAHFNDKTTIYVADINSGHSKQISNQPVLATLNTSFEWSGDSRYIFAIFVPEDRGSEPEKPMSDLLQVRMTTNTHKRLRTFPDLLEGKYEVKLLSYYITGQLSRIDVDNRKIRKIGEPAMIRSISAAPGGKYMIVQRVVKPFSYIVPVSRFGWKKEIWDLNGKALTLLQKSTVNEGIPDSSAVEDFERSDIKWRPDGKGLSLITAPPKDKKEKDSKSDKEDSSKVKQKKYKVIQWLPPFDKDDQKEVYSTKKRMNSVSYAENADVLFIRSGSYRNGRLFAVYPDNPDSTFTIYKYKREGFNRGGKSLMYKTSSTGFPVVQLSPDKQKVYVSGTKYYDNPQEKAPRPFIDKVNIKKGDEKRIFQSSEDYYEQVVSTLDDEMSEIVINRQSTDVIPDAWLVDVSSGDKTKLTSNVEYNKPVTQAKRERIKIERADGINFWIEVILPKDWDGEPLPGIIYQYPTEYDGQEDYDKSQKRYNKNSFPQGLRRGWPERSYPLFVTRGYAVIMADWPVIANQGNPDDGLIWSVQQNSTAVIDSLAARGYVDRSRMAIVGHSFGGFGVVHAMIYTSFFKAGIAGDDTYNRTLTPFGFQRQRNILWDDLGKYIELSPLFWAHHLDGALLIYHGKEDQNSGTWPEQSWRL
ncbi:MAG TPA: prolyl oligopeptidase family serine peptidase, partial [Balneolaceae bacterium]|nr:prolyl oligopeptidase family serine peptidase [Balneolaceae bacterium]